MFCQVNHCCRQVCTWECLYILPRCGLAGLRVNMHIMKFDRRLQIAPLTKAVTIYIPLNRVTTIIRKMWIFCSMKRWACGVVVIHFPSTLPPSFTALVSEKATQITRLSQEPWHWSSNLSASIHSLLCLQSPLRGTHTQSLATEHQGEDVIRAHKTRPLLRSHATQRKQMCWPSAPARVFKNKSTHSF